MSLIDMIDNNKRYNDNNFFEIKNEHNISEKGNDELNNKINDNTINLIINKNKKEINNTNKIDLIFNNII